MSTRGTKDAAHLRASGGTIENLLRALMLQGASPRERRNLVRNILHENSLGRISARAEEPTTQCPTYRRNMAHLRASGGTYDTSGSRPRVVGASPRERRNRAAYGSRSIGARRISARAEEPARKDRAEVRR